MLHRRLAAALFAPVLMLAAAPAAQALIVNGDFEAGDTGFLSEFSNGGATLLGGYSITPNANDVFGLFANLPDNTTGSGLYLAANGTTDATSFVWGQDVAVTPGATYAFSFFLADIFGSPDPVLDVVIDGVTLGADLTPSATGVWESFGDYQFTAAGPLAEIRLVNSSAAFSDNDFGLDDIALRFVSGPQTPGGGGGGSEVPLPAAAPLLLAGLAGLGATARRRRRKAAD